MSAKPPLRLAVLISGRGSNMTAIVRARLAGGIAARPVIKMPIGRRPPGLPAASLGVATATVAAGTGAGAGAPFEQQLGETPPQRVRFCRARRCGCCPRRS